jgi:hypothetical protein
MQRVGSNERLRKLERTQDEALRIATLRQQQRLLEQLSSAGAKDKSTGGIINGAIGTAKDIFNATVKPAFVWTLGAVIFLEIFGAVMGNISVPVLGRVFAGFNEIRPIKRFFDYLFGGSGRINSDINGMLSFPFNTGFGRWMIFRGGSAGMRAQ